MDNTPISNCITQANSILYHSGKEIKAEQWQSVKSPDSMIEICNMFFSTKMPETKEELSKECNPDLPWAEDHFKERVSGYPLNPGNEYKNWPYYKKEMDDKRFRTKREFKFSHTYMERYWPDKKLKGMRYTFGDLYDLVQRLKTHPTTRQGYFSVWHPEDQVERGERIPCTLGYYFLIREGKLNITYHIRSCDIRRHFYNDIYMTIRLAQWVRNFVDPTLEMGTYHMWIGSLHCFKSELKMLKRK